MTSNDHQFRSRCLSNSCSRAETEHSIRTEDANAKSESGEAVRRQNGLKLFDIMGEGTEAAEAKSQGRKTFRRETRSELFETRGQEGANAK